MRLRGDDDADADDDGDVDTDDIGDVGDDDDDEKHQVLVGSHPSYPLPPTPIMKKAR